MSKVSPGPPMCTPTYRSVPAVRSLILALWPRWNSLAIRFDRPPSALGCFVATGYPVTSRMTAARPTISPALWTTRRTVPVAGACWAGQRERRRTEDAMHPMVKPGLRRVWRDGRTVQYGLSPAHAVLVGPVDGPV